MKLYCQPGACSTADHIVLEWAGATYELELIAPAEKSSPEYLKLNPAGVVPTLVDGDFVLTQNAAIFGYIADTYADSGLLGDGSARDRAEVNRWIGYVNSDVHPAFKPQFSPGSYGGEGDCEGSVRAAALSNVARVLQQAEQQLADRAWLTGFRSAADAYLYIMLRWARGLGIETGTNLQAFFERVESDEQVLKALSQEGLKPLGSDS